MMDANKAVELVEHKLSSWLRDFIELLPNLVIAALVVTAAWLIARLLRAGVEKLMARASDSRTLRHLVGNTIYLIVLLIGIFGALSVLHLDKTVTSLLAGAGIMGLALGFAFRDIAANYISGVMMAVQRPIRHGDFIESSGHRGVVEHINLRTTEIRDLQGLQVVIPNKDIFQTPLINYTRNGSRRVDIMLGVSRGEDLESLERVTVKAVESIGDLLPDREVEVFFTGFGDFTVECEVRFWIAATQNKPFNSMRSLAIKAIVVAYAKENIKLPFPIRTLDIGAQGGEELDTVLGKRKPE